MGFIKVEVIKCFDFKWLLKNDEGSYAELSFVRIQQILEVLQDKR